MARDPGELRGPEATLAGDEAVCVAVALDHDRMEQPVKPDRIAECAKRIGFERSSRLFGVGSNRARVEGDQQRSLLGLGLVGEQRVEAPTEAAAPEGAGRGWLAHAGLGMPAAASTAPPLIRASRLALSSR